MSLYDYDLKQRAVNLESKAKDDEVVINQMKRRREMNMAMFDPNYSKKNNKKLSEYDNGKVDGISQCIEIAEFFGYTDNKMVERFKELKRKIEED